MINIFYDYIETIINLVKAYALTFILLGIFIFLLKKYLFRYKRTVFLTILPLFLFIKLSEDYIRSELAVFDGQIYTYLARYITKDLTLIMKSVSDLGSGWVLSIITLVIFFFMRFKDKKIYGNIILGNLLACTAFNNIFKILFHRQRPDILRLVEASGYSFPSGHSMISLSFYGLLIHLIHIRINNRGLKYSMVIILSILVIFIGISRIYLGVHYASDVFAGFSAGMVWLTVYIKIIDRYYLKNHLNYEVNQV